MSCGSRNLIGDKCCCVWEGIIVQRLDSFFFINLFILFIYFWQCWAFTAAHGLSLVVVSWGYSSLWCAGFLLRWFLLLRSTGSWHSGSAVVARGL